MTVRALVIVLAALVGLAGCVTPRGYFDLVVADNPSVASDATSAAVGDFIEVVVTSSVSLPALGERAEQGYAYRLGVCLLPSQPPSPAACDVTNAFRVPDGIVLAEGTELSRAGEVTVSRGQTVTLAHRFRLTAISPIEVTAIGVLYSQSRAGDIGGVSMSLEDQRVTLRFL